MQTISKKYFAFTNVEEFPNPTFKIVIRQVLGR